MLRELDEHGIGDRSLREIAAAVGTSHRMLIHHFGSREGLLVAIVEAVEAGERRAATAIDPAAIDDFAAVFRASWAHFSEPAMAGRERLFYECYGRALAGEVPYVRLLPGAVDSWVEGLASLLRRRGTPAARARASARLYLAVIRGLLLDLLATDDRRGTTAALELFLETHRPG